MTGLAPRIAIAALSVINIGAMLGLGWIAVTILTYDGVLLIELALCAALIAAIALITLRAFALRRRGKAIAAIALLAIAAAPTIAVAGFLLYLEANPIDWR